MNGLKRLYLNRVMLTLYYPLKNYVDPLLSSVALFYPPPPSKQQNTIVFRMFTDGIKRQHWEVMG